MPLRSERFARSEAGFFQQPLTKLALDHLASVERLIIYCGAGVTIDRTAMGWGALVSNVFGPDAQSHNDHPTVEEIALMRDREDPLRLASILTRYRLDEDTARKNLVKHLTPLLQTRLYRSQSWQGGRLAPSACSLAATAAVLGHEVHLITTNYDTYLETDFDGILQRLEALAGLGVAQGGNPKLPAIGLEVYVGRSDSDPPSDSSPSFTAEGATEVLVANTRRDADVFVQLHYLHGRVPESGAADGHLVVSEYDYAQTRQQTVKTLTTLFSGGGGLLVLGASLTDPPLIDALALTSATTGQPGTHRYVVIPRASLGYSDQPPRISNRIVGHLARRCELLGLSLLVPDFRFQTAQFCDELQRHRSVGGTEPATAHEPAPSYGARLALWWDNWQQSTAAVDPVKSYQQVKAAFDGIDGFIRGAASPHYGDAPSSERFRLEIWVRERPRERRCLTLWTNSSGPIMEPTDIRRTAELELHSNNATVRAFLEGRPQYLDADELVESGQTRIPSRWRSYLVVPIYVAVEGWRIPAGAVTLASTADAEAAVLPLTKLEQMQLLIDRMTSAGLSILEPRQAFQRGPEVSE